MRLDSKLIRIGSPIVFLLLAFMTAARRSFILDESFTWGLVQQDSVETITAAIQYTSGNMIGYFALMFGWSRISDGELWMRIPSVAAGAASILAATSFARRTFSLEVATRTAAVASASIPLIYFSTEARSYAFLAFVSCLQWTLVWRAIEDDRAADWLWLAAATGLASGIHIISFFTLPSLGLAVLLLRPGFDVIGALKRLAASGFACLPVVALVAGGAGSKANFVEGLGFGAIGRAARFLAGDHGPLTRDGSGFIVTALILCLLGVGFATFIARHRHDRAEKLLWIWLLGVPVTLTLLITVQPLLWHRFVMASLPATWIAVSLASTRLPRMAGAVAVVLVVVFGLAKGVTVAGDSSDDYRALAIYLEANVTQEGDAIGFITPYEGAGLDYYLARDPLDVLVSRPFEARFDHGATLADFPDVASGNRLFLIDRADGADIWLGESRTLDDFDTSEAGEQLTSYKLRSSSIVDRFLIEIWVRN